MMPATNMGIAFMNIVVFITSMVNFTDALNHMQPMFLGGLYILVKVLSPKPEAWIEATVFDWDKLVKSGATQ